MNILIAEDEEHSRAELHYLLQRLAPDAIFHQAENGQKALEIAAAQPIDVAFLDINMPGINGLAVASLLLQHAKPPLIIFATAYNQHAVRAFELQALDYILKPYNPTRLADTMERIRVALPKRAMLDRKAVTLRHFLDETDMPIISTKLWGGRENQSNVLVDFKDILWLEANNKKVYAYTASGEMLRIYLKMNELEPRLIAHNFARVHKSYIVNLDHVAEIQAWFSNTWQIQMDDTAQSKIPMSRNYAKKLKKRVGRQR